VGDARGGRDIQKHRYPHFSWEISQMPRELYSALNQEEHQTKIPGTPMGLAALEQEPRSKKSLVEIVFRDVFEK
jgi:hypothetical protein